MVNDYSSYQNKMGALDTSHYSGQELQKLYTKSLELHLANDVNKIVKAGIESDASLYFQVENFRLLASKGMIHSKDAVMQRQQLLSADPLNEKLIPYKIAVIEFETYSEEMDRENFSPELATAPLVAYMEKYGNHDKEHLWRLQMIVSQVYLDKNQMTSALKYAQASYEHAPVAARAQIARAVQNIRSQIHSSLTPQY